MKVAFLREFFAMGGIESVLHYTAKELSKYDFEFYAICTNYKGNYLWDTNSSVKVLTLVDKVEEIASEKNTKALIDIINANDIDLICFDHYLGNISEIIAKETKAKTMFWLHCNPMYKADERRSGADMKIRKTPIFSYPPFSWGIDFLVKKKYNEQARQYKYLIDNCDFVATLNLLDKIELIEKLNLNEELSNKIKVLINPIEINPNPKLDKEKLIVYMGRFDLRQKRIERLVDIWRLIYKDLPDWRLEIYGDGESFDMIKAESEDLDRFYLMGRTNNPNEIYDKAAIVALTSQYEGWGMVLAEGQNNACIPIAFDNVGGVKTVLGENDFAGVGVRAFDINEYAKKLKRLCLDDEYRKNLQTNALIKRNEYLFEQNISTWLDIKAKTLK